MGFIDAVKDQFLDVIEYTDQSNKLIVWKFKRDSGNNELKQNSKVIVRESQAVAFIKGGQLADILGPGTYPLNTENFPVLSTLKAFPYLFTSPVISDVYFISTKRFVDNKWATKNPILKRDTDMKMIRLRAFGKFAFKIIDPELFMKEIFGTKCLVLSYDIVGFLSSIVTESFATVIGETKMAVMDLASQYKILSNDVQDRCNKMAEQYGIEFSDILIENLSLPDEVEKLIDEQSGIGLASQDMDSFVQYNTMRAIQDAAKQNGGLAGIGAGVSLGNKMMDNFDSKNNSKSNVEQLREYKSLLDDGIITQEEFDQKKKELLKL